MLPSKRVQGRPARGAGDVGREKLVEAARSILQAKTPQTLSRKAVADAAGVTPALVSYYFPDKALLVSAATRPLIVRHIAELDAVLASSDTHHARLRRVVALLVALSENEAHLVDLALDAVRDDAADPAQRMLLLDAYGRFRDFLDEGARVGAWRTFDPDYVLSALFGMCRAVAHLNQEGKPASATARVDLIIEIALHGLLPRA